MNAWKCPRCHKELKIEEEWRADNGEGGIVITHRDCQRRDHARDLGSIGIRCGDCGRVRESAECVCLIYALTR